MTPVRHCLPDPSQAYLIILSLRGLKGRGNPSPP